MKMITCDTELIERRLASAIADPHSESAARLFGLPVTREKRQLAKAWNFGKAYGMSPASLKQFTRRVSRPTVFERLLSFLFPPRLPVMPAGYAVGEEMNVPESGCKVVPWPVKKYRDAIERHWAEEA